MSEWRHKTMKSSLPPSSSSSCFEPVERIIIFFRWMLYSNPVMKDALLSFAAASLSLSTLVYFI